MKELLYITDRLTKYWARPWVPLALLLVVYLTSERLLPSSISGLNRLVVQAIAGVFAVLVWGATSRLPRVKSGSMGAVLCIEVDGSEEATRARRMFYAALAETLRPRGFRVVLVPDFHVAKFKEPAQYGRLMERTGTRFAIIGQCKHGRSHGKENYLFTLRPMVRHSYLPTETTRPMSDEFAQLFPGHLLISRDDDLQGFEVTAEIVGSLARYFCGYAALLSGDRQLALSLFEALAKDLASSHRQSYRSLPRMTDRMLVTVYGGETMMLIKRYYKSKDRSLLHQAQSIVEKIVALEPDNFEAHLWRGVCLFLTARDTGKARQELALVARRDNAAWVLSDAFLDAYEGNLHAAARKYDSILRGQRAIGYIDTLTEVEEFIQETVTEEPDRWQLQYCLGRISMYKGDYPSALNAFSLFLEHCHSYPREQAAARRYIRIAEDNSRSQGHVSRQSQATTGPGRSLGSWQ